MRNAQSIWIQYKEILDNERGSSVTCDICSELISLPELMFKNQDKCAHPICVYCMIKYINAKVDYRMSQIKCPALNCGHHLDPLSCRPVIPSLVFDRWCDLLCEFAVLKIDRCYCPYKECSALILNECNGNTVSKSKCPNCKKLFCFSCQVAWHEGYSCEKAKQLRDWHDVASGVLAENKKWKRCPTCHHCVERISGCEFVKCRCGTSFCYNCGRILVGGPHRCKSSDPSEAFPVFFSFAFSFAIFLIVFFPIVFAVWLIYTKE